MMNPGWVRLSALGVIALLLPACGTGGGGGTLTPTVAPGIPTNITARAGNRSATIEWTASVVGAQYLVLRSQLPDGPFFAISVPAQFRAPTTYVDAGLVNGTTYYYQVVSRNQFGDSPPSTVVSAIPGFKPKAVEGGGTGLLAVLPDGTVWQWGAVQGGVLSDVPIQVPGLVEITAVSINLNHNLALGSDGSVWAWGLNSSGQLGPLGTPVTTVPVPVTGITDAIAVAAGEQHSLALTHDGRVLAWGSNGAGAFGLGTGTPAQSSTPQEVPGLTGIIAIAAGTFHSLALRNDGLVFSWGTNANGELGNPPVSPNIFPPTLISGLNGVVAISATVFNSLALRSDGTVYGWGGNSSGQLGTGNTTTPVPSPAKTNFPTGIVDIVTRGSHSLAVRNDGSVWACGYNADGQCGIGSVVTPQPTPVPVLSVKLGASVAATGLNGVAIEKDGTVWTWGDNVNGGLGNGTGQVGLIPVELPNFTGAIGAAGGDNWSLAVRSNGTVWGWGTNTAGQLGNGGTSPNPVTTPVQATGITTATAVAAGYTHGLALLTGGSVVGWGNNGFGQVGDGTSGNTRLNPVPLPVLNSGITAITTAEMHSMAIRNDATNDRTVWTWGYNAQGQLGQGTTGASNPTPTKISNLDTVISMAVGDRHSIIAKENGTVYVWGYNDFGQLGQGTTGNTAVPTPTQVLGITDAVAVGAGYFHCLVIRKDGTVLAWGLNDNGQLGDGTKTNNPLPAPVPGLTGVTSVCGGIYYSLALKNDGTVWSWGQNSYGQLGNTAPGFSSVPIPVLQLPAVSAIAAGSTHAIALPGNGTVRSWGRNFYHQLGVPYVLQSSTPVTVTQ